MLTRKEKIRQNRAIQRINSLYYKHKRELEIADLKFVGAMVWRRSCKKEAFNKEIIFTKEERIQLKKLIKKYYIDLESEE